MEQLAAGRDAALDALMERHGPRLYNFLYRRLGNAEDASDLAQETFVRVYKNRDSFNPKHTFAAWLYTIAANLARNHNRWRSRHPALSLDAPLESDGGAASLTLGDSLPAKTASPVEETLNQERASAVRAAVARLPDDMREVIALCEFEDFSAADASAILKMNVKAAQNRLYRARQILREKLKQWL
jgi:RNA polymerase sigma-70 factor (ECF subfamily)